MSKQGPSAASQLMLDKATIEEVERKKHKKNPFDSRYVEFCLTDLSQVLHRCELQLYTVTAKKGSAADPLPAAACQRLSDR